MSYDPQTWALGLAGGTPLNAVRLNFMEAGIAAAHSLIAELALADHTHTSAQITDATSTNTVDKIVKRDGTGFIAVSGITGLSTATGSTQAVPKSQLDAAIAAVAGAAHTHVLANITDVTVVGSQVAKAADATTARTVLDVPSNSELATQVASGVGTAESYAAARTDTMTHTLSYAGGVYPIRPNTVGTKQHVQWIGALSDPIPTDGTAAGGTRKAAPTDTIFYR